jgi:hypothetical protein
MNDHLIFELQLMQIRDQLEEKNIQGKGNLGQGLQYKLFYPYEEIWPDFEPIDHDEEEFDENVGDNKFRLILQEEKDRKMEMKGENTLNCSFYGICGVHTNFKINVHIHCSGIHYIAQVIWQG